MYLQHTWNLFGTIQFDPMLASSKTVGRRLARPLSQFAAGLAKLESDAALGALASVPALPPRTTLSLLHPPGACSAFTRSGSQYPPLGLNLLKAVIGDPRRCDVIEADGYGLTNEETMAEMRVHSPTAVGMTITCGTRPLVHTWATVAKAIFPDRPPLVIVGGPATAFEHHTIFEECPAVDAVVRGDGEVNIRAIVNILEDNTLDQAHKLSELATVKGILVRNQPPSMNDLAIPRLPKEGFDSLPFPDLDASPVARYRAPDASRLPMVTMITQRGCIARCTFCNTPQKDGNQIRGWSNERIVAEIQHLQATHGVREVSFVDDVFTNRRGGPVKLCNMMVDAGLDVTWYCNARADQISPKMARAMQRAGCHQVFLGFESGCDDILRAMRKGETVAQLERGAKLLKDVGIRISVGFIVGYPGETDASVERTIALCNRVQPNRVQFTRFTPIPGSEAASLQDADHAVDGFHQRDADDQIERWIAHCYDRCRYAPSV